jgi:peptidyl-prolyl cis-trans isomerase SurA
MKWKTGSISPVEVNTQNNSLNFIKIEKIIAPTGKTLSEARGYAVAEYQDYLERKWLEELRSSYKIVVNQETLDKLIK